MKPADISRDWRVILGLALIVIGVSNWIVGDRRTRQYGAIIAQRPNTAVDQSYRSFDELEGGADAVLQPFTDEQRRVSYATARMDFYHATVLTGDAFVIAGLIVTCLGFLALIRRDAHRVRSRLAQLLRAGPPDS
jgi:hypothetical protein